MALYKCNTKDCTGRLNFDDPMHASAAGSNVWDGRTGFRVVILDKAPRQCTTCRQSYFEYELEPA